MKSKAFTLTRYDADEGFVFDWKDLSEHKVENEDGSVYFEHLYAKTLFIGANDSIDNYIEVEVGE